MINIKARKIRSAFPSLSFMVYNFLQTFSMIIFLRRRWDFYLILLYFVCVFPLFLPQATTKTLAQQQEQLKKMETFSALQETNKLLKMDRDKLEQELQQAQARVSLIPRFCFSQLFFSRWSELLWGCLVPFFLLCRCNENCCCSTHSNLFNLFVWQVTKLQSDISPLHHSMSLLSEKNGSLQADKRILEEDIKRWKAKTQVPVARHNR